MSSMKKRGLIALAVATVAGLAVAIPTVIASSTASGPVSVASPAGPSPKAVFTGSCNGSKASYAANDDNQEITTSTSFVPITGMSVGFATSTPCAMITFSDQSAGVPDEVMFVRALVNGTACRPGAGGTQWAGNENAPGYLAAHSYTFVCTGFTLQHHNIATVEMRSFFGTLVSTGFPTMVVRYG